MAGGWWRQRVQRFFTLWCTHDERCVATITSRLVVFNTPAATPSKRTFTEGLERVGGSAKLGEYGKKGKVRPEDKRIAPV